MRTHGRLQKKPLYIITGTPPQQASLGIPAAACIGDVPWIHGAMHKNRLPPHGVVCRLKAGVTHLEHWDCLLCAVSSMNWDLWTEELCLFNKANCIMDIFHTVFLKPMSQMHKLISCIFKVLSNDLRGQQLLDMSLWSLNSTICWCFQSDPECIMSRKPSFDGYQLQKAPQDQFELQANIQSSSHWLLMRGLEADRGGRLDYWLVFCVQTEWEGGVREQTWVWSSSGVNLSPLYSLQALL